MPKLSVSYCIVCEDIRTEVRGKYSILGFFGTLPNVQIKVQDIGPKFGIGRLVFVINIIGPAGKYQFDFVLTSPNGEVKAEAKLDEMEVLDDKYHRSLGMINMSGIPLPEAGDYKVELSHEGKVFYESSLNIIQGEPEVFV